MKSAILLICFCVIANACLDDVELGRYRRAEGDIAWGYDSYCRTDQCHIGPSLWFTIEGNNGCISGSAGDQTPIDIDCGEAASADYNVSYVTDNAVTIKSNGHTIQMDFPQDDGNSRFSETNVVNWENTESYDASATQKFKLLQAHFHWQKDGSTLGSEHSVNGKFYPMEIHFVHWNANYADIGAALNAPSRDSLQVLGVMFEVQSNPNPELQKIIDAFQSLSGFDGVAKGDAIDDVQIDATALVPDLTNFSFYRGGLTTPPCNLGVANQIVQWVLADEVLGMSQAQLDFFKTMTYIDYEKTELISEYGNSRPIQCRGQRKIWKVGGTTSKCNLQACNTKQVPLSLASAVTTTASTPENQTESTASTAESGSCDDGKERSYLVWAAIMTTIVVMLVMFGLCVVFGLIQRSSKVDNNQTTKFRNTSHI